MTVSPLTAEVADSLGNPVADADRRISRRESFIVYRQEVTTAFALSETVALGDLCLTDVLGITRMAAQKHLVLGRPIRRESASPPTANRTEAFLGKQSTARWGPVLSGPLSTPILTEGCGSVVSAMDLVYTERPCRTKGLRHPKIFPPCFVSGKAPPQPLIELKLEAAWADIHFREGAAS